MNCYGQGGSASVRHSMRRLAWFILVPLLMAGCATPIRPPKNVPPRIVTLKTTGYCNCRSCCNWERNWLFRPVIASGPNKGKRKDVGITANGSVADDGTIAADTSFYPFGTVMYVPGYGYGRVEDRGGAIKGYHIDLWFDDHDDALDWGVRYLKVKVWLR
jgi:3D (Asp-Asp-Asp) domain-containing protein